MAPPSQLRIRAQAVRRLLAEIKSYENEAEQEKLKLDKMKGDNADSYDIKQQQRVIAEANKMIPDSQSRLSNAVEDLRTFLSDSTLDQASEDYKEAQEALELASV